MSAHVYVLALETRLIQIRFDKSVRGYCLRNKAFKLTTYADEIFFGRLPFARADSVKQFEKISSLKVNIEKCKAAWEGGAKHDTSKPVRSNWNSLFKNSIRILGVRHSCNRQISEKKNSLLLHF